MYEGLNFFQPFFTCCLDGQTKLGSMAAKRLLTHALLVAVNLRKDIAKCRTKTKALERS